MNPALQNLEHLTRRHFLKQSQLGFGAIALSSLLGRDGAATPLPTIVNRSPPGSRTFQPRRSR